MLEEYREVDGYHGYLPAQAAREIRGTIYVTYFPHFGGKSSALLEMDKTTVPGEGHHKVHGDGLIRYEYMRE